jgi:hypothetical protein
MLTQHMTKELLLGNEHLQQTGTSQMKDGADERL